MVTTSSGHPFIPQRHLSSLYSLREVAGVEEPFRVYVPFSMSDLSQTETKLGSFSHSFLFAKEFQYLTLTYDLI
jgi:hypothetical protein